jgi:hypothetical protein
MFSVATAADVYRIDSAAVFDTQRELVPLNATWSYLEANNNPANLDADFETTWFRKDMTPASYDGPAFRTGVGLFGYGEIDYASPATELNVLLDPAGRPEPNTAYFTRTFQFAGNPIRVGGLVADVLADDGAFFYLNGQTAGHFNVNDTDDGVYSARASGPGNEVALTPVNLAEPLTSGTNYLAVSVHNRRFQDTDLGFDMRLSYWLDGESVLDNDSSDLGAPPDVVLSVVEVQGQSFGAGTNEIAAATNHGTLLMRSNGTFRYSPAAGFVGTDTFTYNAGDGVAISTTTTVTLQVGTGSTGPTCNELDISGSGVVDRQDFAMLTANYGAVVPPGSTADFNADGRIGLRDVIYLRDALGQACGGSAEAIVRSVAAVDRVHTENAPHRLRASVRRAVDALSAKSAVTEPADIVSARVLRVRRGAWA